MTVRRHESDKAEWWGSTSTKPYVQWKGTVKLTGAYFGKLMLELMREIPRAGTKYVRGDKQELTC